MHERGSFAVIMTYEELEKLKDQNVYAVIQVEDRPTDEEVALKFKLVIGNVAPRLGNTQALVQLKVK